MSDALLAKWCPGINGDVLSIGSQDDRDGRGRRYRDYFRSARSYTTSEVAPRPDCDLVLDVRAMPEIADASYDCVFCSGVLEHVDDCHAAVAEIHRILRPGGLFLVGVPFGQRLHCAPMDFWRFTGYGLKYLLRAFAVEEIVPFGDDPKFAWTYWARARKVAS
jgi:SAM-dependent methyltransferase